ncbi:MAG: glycine cleavage T C-terminal barrel domain-containing protein, partial [Albidovulum sp.]
WKADLLTEFTPFETGLHRFVKLEKGDFIGKAALTKLHAAGERKAFVSLKVDATHAPARGGASLMVGDKVVGTISSADWGHRVGMNLAYAFIDPALSAVGTKLHLDMYGDMVAVEVIAPSPYDPDFSRIRG